MPAGVLRSPRAIPVNLKIMRAFLRLRRLSQGHFPLPTDFGYDMPSERVPRARPALTDVSALPLP